MRYTTIGIYDETKAKLDDMKLCPTETYDHLVKRLIDELINGGIISVRNAATK